MNKKYQIFVSSTFADLQEERAKVRDAIVAKKKDFFELAFGSN